MRLALPFAVVAALFACDTGSSSAPAKPACDLSVDTLAGKAFVMLEATPDGDVKDAQARIGFRSVEGRVYADYTVDNALHVYEYECAPTKREGELKCLTEPFLDRACLALEVNAEGSCSAEKLREMGFDGDDEDMKAGIAKAKELVGKAKGSDQWERFKLMNNNVGNTLMGQLFVKVDSKHCRVQLDDMFVTIFNGARTEDFNPVGTNAFVPADGELLFDDCDKEGFLVDLDSAELPAKLADIPPVRERAAGTEVHYFYVGDDTVKAEEGCTYELDHYANWKPVAKGVAVTPGDDGAIQWHVSHTWSSDDLRFVGNDKGMPLKGGFTHVLRRKTCGGETTELDSVCNAARVTP